METKSFTELLTYTGFWERLKYLQMISQPTDETFGPLRHMNQTFYRSSEWRQARMDVLVRDGGYDLASNDRPLGKSSLVLVHHMNPINPDILRHTPWMCLDPEYLITTCDTTHKMIHFGIPEGAILTNTPRSLNDTRLW